MPSKIGGGSGGTPKMGPQRAYCVGNPGIPLLLSYRSRKHWAKYFLIAVFAQLATLVSIRYALYSDSWTTLPVEVRDITVQSAGCDLFVREGTGDSAEVGIRYWHNMGMSNVTMHDLGTDDSRAIVFASVSRRLASLMCEITIVTPRGGLDSLTVGQHPDQWDVSASGKWSQDDVSVHIGGDMKTLTIELDAFSQTHVVPRRLDTLNMTMNAGSVKVELPTHGNVTATLNLVDCMATIVGGLARINLHPDATVAPFVAMAANAVDGSGTSFTASAKVIHQHHDVYVSTSAGHESAVYVVAGPVEDATATYYGKSHDEPGLLPGSVAKGIGADKDLRGSDRPSKFVLILQPIAPGMPAGTFRLLSSPAYLALSLNVFMLMSAGMMQPEVKKIHLFFVGFKDLFPHALVHPVDPGTSKERRFARSAFDVLSTIAPTNSSLNTFIWDPVGSTVLQFIKVSKPNAKDHWEPIPVTDADCIQFYMAVGLNLLTGLVLGAVAVRLCQLYVVPSMLNKVRSDVLTAASTYSIPDAATSALEDAGLFALRAAFVHYPTDGVILSWVNPSTAKVPVDTYDICCTPVDVPPGEDPAGYRIWVRSFFAAKVAGMPGQPQQVGFLFTVRCDKLPTSGPPALSSQDPVLNKFDSVLSGQYAAHRKRLPAKKSSQRELKVGDTYQFQVFAYDRNKKLIRKSRPSMPQVIMPQQSFVEYPLLLWKTYLGVTPKSSLEYYLEATTRPVNARQVVTLRGVQLNLLKSDSVSEQLFGNVTYDASLVLQIRFDGAVIQSPEFSTSLARGQAVSPATVGMTGGNDDDVYLGFQTNWKNEDNPDVSFTLVRSSDELNKLITLVVCDSTSFKKHLTTTMTMRDFMRELHDSTESIVFPLNNLAGVLQGGLTFNKPPVFRNTIQRCVDNPDAALPFKLQSERNPDFFASPTVLAGEPRLFGSMMTLVFATEHPNIKDEEPGAKLIVKVRTSVMQVKPRGNSNKPPKTKKVESLSICGDPVARRRGEITFSLAPMLPTTERCHRAVVEMYCVTNKGERFVGSSSEFVLLRPLLLADLELGYAAFCHMHEISMEKISLQTMGALGHVVKSVEVPAICGYREPLPFEIGFDASGAVCPEKIPDPEGKTAFNPKKPQDYCPLVVKTSDLDCPYITGGPLMMSQLPRETPASKTPASKTPASKTPASKTPASARPSSKRPATVGASDATTPLMAEVSTMEAGPIAVKSTLVTPSQALVQVASDLIWDYDLAVVDNRVNMLWIYEMFPEIATESWWASLIGPENYNLRGPLARVFNFVLFNIDAAMRGVLMVVVYFFQLMMLLLPAIFVLVLWIVHDVMRAKYNPDVDPSAEHSQRFMADLLVKPRWFTFWHMTPLGETVVVVLFGYCVLQVIGAYFGNFVAPSGSMSVNTVLVVNNFMFRVFMVVFHIFAVYFASTLVWFVAGAVIDPQKMMPYAVMIVGLAVLLQAKSGKLQSLRAMIQNKIKTALDTTMHCLAQGFMKDPEDDETIQAHKEEAMSLCQHAFSALTLAEEPIKMKLQKSSGCQAGASAPALQGPMEMQDEMQLDERTLVQVNSICQRISLNQETGHVLAQLYGRTKQLAAAEMGLSFGSPDLFTLKATSVANMMGTIRKEMIYNHFQNDCAGVKAFLDDIRTQELHKINSAVALAVATIVQDDLVTETIRMYTHSAIHESEVGPAMVDQLRINLEGSAAWSLNRGLLSFFDEDHDFAAQQRYYRDPVQAFIDLKVIDGDATQANPDRQDLISYINKQSTYAKSLSENGKMTTSGLVRVVQAVCCDFPHQSVQYLTRAAFVAGCKTLGMSTEEIAEEKWLAQAWKDVVPAGMHKMVSQADSAELFKKFYGGFLWRAAVIDLLRRLEIGGFIGAKDPATATALQHTADIAAYADQIKWPAWLQKQYDSWLLPVGDSPNSPKLLPMEKMAQLVDFIVFDPTSSQPNSKGLNQIASSGVAAVMYSSSKDGLLFRKCIENGKPVFKQLRGAWCGAAIDAFAAMSTIPADLSVFYKAAQYRQARYNPDEGFVRLPQLRSYIKHKLFMIEDLGASAEKTRPKAAGYNSNDRSLWVTAGQFVTLVRHYLQVDIPEDGLVNGVFDKCPIIQPDTPGSTAAEFKDFKHLADCGYELSEFIGMGLWKSGWNRFFSQLLPEGYDKQVALQRLNTPNGPFETLAHMKEPEGIVELDQVVDLMHLIAKPGVTENDMHDLIQKKLGLEVSVKSVRESYQGTDSENEGFLDIKGFVITLRHVFLSVFPSKILDRLGLGALDILLLLTGLLLLIGSMFGLLTLVVCTFTAGASVTVAIHTALSGQMVAAGGFKQGKETSGAGSDLGALLKWAEMKVEQAICAELSLPQTTIDAIRNFASKAEAEVSHMKGNAAKAAGTAAKAAPAAKK